MSSDKEVQAINEKKMKEKGLAVKAKQEQKYNPESLLLQLLELMRVRGLEMLNISEDAKAMIFNHKQNKLNEQNGVNKNG